MNSVLVYFANLGLENALIISSRSLLIVKGGENTKVGKKIIEEEDDDG